MSRINCKSSGATVSTLIYLKRSSLPCSENYHQGLSFSMVLILFFKMQCILFGFLFVYLIHETLSLAYLQAYYHEETGKYWISGIHPSCCSSFLSESVSPGSVSSAWLTETKLKHNLPCFLQLNTELMTSAILYQQ